MDDPVRSERELGALLDRLLDPVLSTRRSAGPLAAGIAPLPRAEQDRILHWTRVVARTNIELAFQFAATAPAALARFDEATFDAWAIHALDVYDANGLHAATQVLGEPARFAGERSDPTAIGFAEVVRILQSITRGLAGRPLRLEMARPSYTDTATLYLLPRITRGHARDDNFFLYKATVVLLWAQTRFGTYAADLHGACARFPDPERALDVLNVLETVRLEARIARLFPGLGRRIAALRSPQAFDVRCAALTAPSATIDDSLALLASVYADPPRFADLYQTVLRPAEASATRSERIEREKQEFQKALARLEDDAALADGPSGARAADYALEVEPPEGASEGTAGGYTLHRDGQATVLPPEMKSLVDSILSDLGTFPDEYLVPHIGADETDNGSVARSTTRAPDRTPPPAFYYDEWDHQRGHYRKSWCALRELDVELGDPVFVDQTLAKYAPDIRRLKRTFELMREEERLLRRQAEGDGIDFDAVVEGFADMRGDGAELSPLLFTKRRRHERDLAVMLMVDMSGSTKGWINEAEREALVMLCEALEILGDRYAIYGFSGMTRRRCEIFRIKRFEEAYDRQVRGRIAGIEPQDFTRMGAAIRHLTMQLERVQARTKVLITLSDGKPDDYSDEYRGEYGIEDTRKALLEAKRIGIRPFCVTIDHEAREYLPHMYGAANWTVVDDPSLLPVRIAGIYQRLTT